MVERYPELRRKFRCILPTNDFSTATYVGKLSFSNEKDYIWYTMDWHVNNTHPDENYVAFYIDDPFDPTGEAEVDGVKLPASPSAPSIHVTKKFIPTRFGRLNFGPWMAWWGHNKNRDDGAHFDNRKSQNGIYKYYEHWRWL